MQVWSFQAILLNFLQCGTGGGHVFLYLGNVFFNRMAMYKTLSFISQGDL